MVWKIPRNTGSVVVLAALLLPGIAPAAVTNVPAIATFSIVACDTVDGIWGVAVASKFLAVGSVVPWARGNVGAIATQAFGNTSHGPRGLDLLERGLTPNEVLTVLLRPDTLRDRRQMGIVGPHGLSATYTGKGCQNWAGGRCGKCYAVQGNILTGPEVVEAMARSFESSNGFLGDRMLAALEAGDAAGGDSRGHQAAAIYLVQVGRGWQGNNDRLCDLRVDDSPDPIRELHRVYNILAAHRGDRRRLPPARPGEVCGSDRARRGGASPRAGFSSALLPSGLL